MLREYIKWVGGALLLTFIIIQYSTCNSYRQDLQDNKSLIKASQDTINYYKEKNGENSAKIALLEGDKDNLLLILGESNSRLAKLIKQGASSGTVYEQITKFDTTTLVRIDTINNKPSFNDTTTNQWLTLKLNLKNDSLSKFIELRDSVSISFQNIPQKGFLKPSKSVVIISNNNPYVKITGLKSFNIPVKSSATKVKFWIGVGLGLGFGYLVFK